MGIHSDSIMALEALLGEIRGISNPITSSNVQARLAFDRTKSKEIARIESEISYLASMHAPRSEGPFKIMSVRKVDGHHQYLLSVSSYRYTQHPQDARVWTTAAGAERALQKLVENFPYLHGSYKIV